MTGDNFKVGLDAIRGKAKVSYLFPRRKMFDKVYTAWPLTPLFTWPGF
jgi:hypothetical protein